MDKIPEQSTMTKGESTSSSSNDECQDLRDAPEVSTELGELEQQGKRPMFRLRPEDDEEPQDWWFCSTAIPLLAATSGPLANVLSIAGTKNERIDPLPEAPRLMNLQRWSLHGETDMTQRIPE